MAIKVSNVEVWAGDIPDQPGGLANVLEALGNAGADLECVIARRQPDKPGMGVVFVTPVKGRRVQNAARSVGLSPASNMATLRLEGPNTAGGGGTLARAVADAEVNVRGVSAIRFGRNFIAFIGLDSSVDAKRAATAIRGAIRGASAAKSPRRSASRRVMARR